MQKLSTNQTQKHGITGMKPQELSDFYETLDEQTRVEFVGFLVFFLSQASRNVYPEARKGSQKHITIREIINELIHRSATQQLKMLTPNVQGYPDTVYIEIITEDTKFEECNRLITWAITKAKQSVDSLSS